MHPRGRRATASIVTALRQLSEQLLAGPLPADAQPMAPRFLAEPIAAGAYFVS